MKRLIAMTPTAPMILFFAIISTFPTPVLAVDLTGTVVSVEGLDVAIEIQSIGPFSPAVGDAVDVIEVADGGKVQFDIGDWEVTEVDGKMVKAAAVNALGVNPPKVNMKAVIHLSPGPVHAGEPPADTPEKKKQPVARGKVIMTRGEDVTIQLEEGQPRAGVGDKVELSFTTAGVVIPVGTWRVSALKGDGIIEAKPLAPEGKPNIDMDARVFTDASRKEAKVETKKKPDRTVESKIEDGDRSPLETACLKGDANACNELGIKYAKGKGVALNLSRAVEFYRKACDGGSAAGCFNLGNKYEHGLGVRKDKKLAAEYYQKGCDGGNARGCSNLGYMYEKGYGVGKDEKLAVEYYRKGCEQGNARGCNNLGYMYANGIGVSEDQNLAVEYYRKACDGGNARGCNNLGYMYANGYGVSEDQNLAAEYYRKACDGGDAMGCSNLGYMYANGIGVSEDQNLAAEYYQKGCDGGDGRGCGNLGWTLYQGRGTTPDRARGMKLLKQACKMGHEWSCDKLKALGK